MTNKIIDLFPVENIGFPAPAACEWIVIGTTVGKRKEIVDYVDEYVPEECRDALIALIEEYAGLNGAESYRAGYDLGLKGETPSRPA